LPPLLYLPAFKPLRPKSRNLFKTVWLMLAKPGAVHRSSLRAQRNTTRFEILE
jgi:hypothetical protein